MKQSKQAQVMKGKTQRVATVLGIYTGRRGRGVPVSGVVDIGSTFAASSRATPPKKGAGSGKKPAGSSKAGEPRSKVKRSLFKNVTAAAHIFTGHAADHTQNNF